MRLIKLIIIGIIGVYLPLLIALLLTSNVGFGESPPPLTATEIYATKYTSDLSLIREVEFVAAAPDTGEGELFLLILHTIIFVESSYNPLAESLDGRAVGLMQLTGPAVIDAARYCRIPIPPRKDLFIPSINILLGTCYLHVLLDRYEGDWYSVIVAYHGGGRAVTRLKEGKLLGHRTANYGLKILYLLDRSIK